MNHYPFIETPKMNHYPMAQSSITPYPVPNGVHHYPISHANGTISLPTETLTVKHWLGYTPDFVKLESPRIPVSEPIKPIIQQVYVKPEVKEEVVEKPEPRTKPQEARSEPKDVKREERPKETPKASPETVKRPKKKVSEPKSEPKPAKVKDEYTSLKKVGVTISPKRPARPSVKNDSTEDTNEGSHTDQLNGFDASGFKS